MTLDAVQQDLCVLVIDMQKGFCDPGGATAQAGMKMERIDIVVAEHDALLRAVRERGIPVVFTRYGWRANGADVDRRMEAAFGPGSFRWGGRDVELIDEMSIDAGDTVIDKPRFDAFLGTPLDLILRQQGTSRLLITGLATNGCVETTARTATQLGYSVSVASDATSAVDGQHEPALRSISVGFGEIVRWRDVMSVDDA